MRKCREILRLKQMELSNRKIARSLKISHTTVGETLFRAERVQVNLEKASKLDDRELEQLLYPDTGEICSGERLVPDWANIHRELRKKGVTRWLLWEEYRLSDPRGYSYSQFCENYQRWCKKIDVTMKQHHRAGEKTFVDYAGLKVPITNSKTGEITEHPLFVGVLGASNFTYAELCRGEDLFSWCMAHVNMFSYFKGVTEVTVVDNLKSGIKKANFYEPDVNPTYHRLAEYYQTVVIPARVRKPRDKAKAEVGVQIAERWILAVLRNRTFFSVEEANAAIRPLLKKLNNRPFKKLPGCRRSLFETLDKPALKPLPQKPYTYAQHQKARVNIDYHIEVQNHYYSVPYSLVHKHMEVWFNNHTVDVFYKSNRIVTHARSFVKGGYTTVKEHMPKNHRYRAEWTPQRMIRWAGETGPNTAKLAQKIMDSKPHPELGFRSCLGLIRLSKDYGKQRLEASCRRALYIRGYSCKSVTSILKSGLDRMPLPRPPQPSKSLLTHENIRGASFYNPKQGGNSATVTDHG